MAHVDKHPPGAFCWMELATTDQSAAKKFYSSLFGWVPDDVPMGPDAYYTIFRLQGRACAAAETMGAERRCFPPHWSLYIGVENADVAQAKAQSLGGTVIAPAFDIASAGRMAVLRDPTGAFFSVWQPKQNAGIGIAGDPGTFCWADLSTPDRERAKTFYSNLFGWKLTAGQGKDPSGYLHIMNGEKAIGGIQTAEGRDRNAPPHWLIYWYVSDVDTSTAKAESLGATLLMPPMTIENVGRM